MIIQHSRPKRFEYCPEYFLKAIGRQTYPKEIVAIHASNFPEFLRSRPIFITCNQTVLSIIRIPRRTLHEGEILNENKYKMKPKIQAVSGDPIVSLASTDEVASSSLVSSSESSSESSVSESSSSVSSSIVSSSSESSSSE